jgi:tRNA-dihydrouridine synthase B
MHRPIHNPVEALRKNPFVLAPMAGITDHAFRSFMKAKSAGVVVTELVSAMAVEHQSQKSFDIMSFDSSQHPIGIQLFGEDPDILANAAQAVEDAGADFVDLNFGCPVPKVVKKGGGSAILKDLRALQKVLRTVKSAINIPLTIKIRTGWDAQMRNSIQVCEIAADEGVSWVAIHGRTRAQGYSGLADWNYIAEVKAKAQLPVLGNGDITSANQAVQRLRQSGCDGVLIGRGCLKNPFIFEDSMALWKNETPSTSARSMVDLFQELERNLVSHCDDYLVPLQLKKFAAWYSAGYPGAALFRKLIFQMKSHDEIMSFALQFFHNITMSAQEDTSQEEFLMGGHG